MKLVDVHAHLEHPRFEGDLDEVIGRFVEAGGELIVSSGVNPETNRKALELAGKYDVVSASFGLYPIDALVKEVERERLDDRRQMTEDGGKTSFLRDVKEFDVDEELGWIEEHAGDCVAIGEVGLDYSYEISYEGNKKQVIDNRRAEVLREKQKEVFRKVLRLAKKIDKCVVVHSRKAELDAVGVLEEEGFANQTASLPDRFAARPLRSQTGEVAKVVMHCFNGRKSLIKRGVENGWFFSVPANVVRLEHFKMLVEMVPLGQLLTETDAPWLSPVVGERNESANVLVTLKEIARIKGVSLEGVASGVFENACGLFGV